VIRTIEIGVIGDYDANKTSHLAMMAAIEHASRHLSVATKPTWLPTSSFLAGAGRKTAGRYDAFWASSGSPYHSIEGAVDGIRLARESGRPFIGT
jgi:CTP synthase (UTP-ammonia lyase)